MKTSGIYIIRHKASGKAYVGRSTDIANRWDLHKRHTEQKKDRSPLHRAMRKYGYDAFDWEILVEAHARDHVALEYQHIVALGTMTPAGYNVGGTAGGQPPRELLDLMGPAERDAKIAEMRSSSKKMHATLMERRKDPEYNAAYLAKKSADALKREVARRKRIEEDPEYAAKEMARRQLGGLKAWEKIHARKASDPAFAEDLRLKKRAAAIVVRARDPRTLRAKARQEAANGNLS